MKLNLRLWTLFVLLGFFSEAQKKSLPADAPKILSFKKKKIASESFESVGVFDVNDDENPDLVSGSYWYEGPDYLERHFIGDLKRHGEYYDDFSTLPLEINGDGLMDYITGGWFEQRLVWRENPGNDDPWPEHLIANAGNIEATRLWDVDGDGTHEIIPNTPNDPLIIYRLKKEKNGKGASVFEAFEIFGKHDHGLGFGDINGDGKGDFVLRNGWLQSPENPFNGNWVLHADFDLGKASVPILVLDVNADGLNDIIVGQGHDYGLDWYEQKLKDGNTTWTKHSIDSDNSQFHTMEWADIDGDGKGELITGKRYRAHNGKDPGSNDPYGIYYYQFNGNKFIKHTIDHGTFGSGKGTGIHFAVKDLNRSGLKDIIVAGKDGLYIYYNLGNDN